MMAHGRRGFETELHCGRSQLSIEMPFARGGIHRMRVEASSHEPTNNTYPEILRAANF
jgi:hypothetical protein